MTGILLLSFALWNGDFLRQTLSVFEF